MNLAWRGCDGGGGGVGGREGGMAAGARLPANLGQLLQWGDATSFEGEIVKEICAC